MISVRLLINKLFRKVGWQLSRFDELPYGIRDSIHAFIDSHATELTGAILDVGSAEESYVSSKYSSQAKVTTLDLRPPADVIGSISSAPFPDNTFDAIVCMEVMEHVQDIGSASRELYRILKPGGTFLASAPFMYELHGEEYGDYWRITRQGWEYLLRDFINVEITAYGKYPNRYPNTYFVYAKKPSTV